MSTTVFFSWQADTPTKTGRNFLRQALEEACKIISQEAKFEEAPRDFEIEVDSDTSGVPGQPPIVETIFEKIDIASVFVADLTFVSKRFDGDRLVPNPNVLIECGRALKSLGYKRLIYVMNTTYGEPSKDNMPFNLMHVRFPTKYKLSETSSPEEIRAEKDRLVPIFVKYIEACLTEVPAPILASPPNFSETTQKDGPARFRSSGEELGVEEKFSPMRSNSLRKVFLNDGPCIWLRMFPMKVIEKRWAIPELKEIVRANVNSFYPIYSETGGYSFLRATDGIGMFNVSSLPTTPESKDLNASSVTFLFENGEIWSIDTDLLSYYPDMIFDEVIEESFVKGLNNYLAFLRKLGVSDSVKWMAGITGIKGRRLTYDTVRGSLRFGADPICLTDTIMAEGEFGNDLDPTTTLMPFFTDIFNKCGISRTKKLPK